MDNKKEFKTIFEDTFTDVTVLANSLNFFYEVFSLNHLQLSKDDCRGMCDTLYIINEFAKQVREKYSLLEELNIDSSIF